MVLIIVTRQKKGALRASAPRRLSTLYHGSCIDPPHQSHTLNRTSDVPLLILALPILLLIKDIHLHIHEPKDYFTATTSISRHSAVALYDMHLRETESDCYKNKKALPQDSHFSSRNPKPVNKTYSVSLNVNNFEITDLKLADSVSKLVDLNVSVYEVDPNDVSRPRALCESLVISEWSLDSRNKKW